MRLTRNTRKNKMLTLVISHYIYLNREQRYKLFDGENIETFGVSVPVWFDKGTTSEPAKEVFCRYLVKNVKNHEAIKTLKDGYEINIPQSVRPLAKFEEQEDYSINSKKKISNYFDRSLKLLDPEDGGAEWLEFKQYATMKHKRKKVEVVHSVEIKDIRILENTLS